ncbi:hypothetical protein COU87_05365 [Candidatus Roizmanbacteria bacterium CG10_big_fil_rev_8_21_14_0_10_39_12]|uniref:Glycosyltransferase 2-like domain-containing protein n=1 Tax=Candidatus Roizmanbacteria bacterium CG10_big_fil_rev_8_21_14_0_10_39_12 TaxID=1974852 RepID=A0A2M8KMY6_9BACT|nr:MAG: hypothetical protein COU87_05365 [Candidatus Roizmanbacteria bacterium CG10_big_fil_rev_8_21_14_0_10_39_12]
MKRHVQKKKTISLIVLNYNGRHLLDEYFTSVFSQTRVPEEVIMFDNLCTDGSREFVRKKFPTVKIITEDRFNTGTALAINTAFSHAHGDFIILQSNDIVLDKKCIETLFDSIHSDESIGIVTSVSIRENNRKLNKYIVDHSGGFLDLYGFALANNQLIPIKNIPDFGEVFFAYGDSIIVRRKAFEDVHGFDTRLFMMHDDIDFSWRIRHLGYKIIYTKHSVIYHKGSVTIKSLYDRPKIRYWSERNSIRCYLKNTTLKHLIKTLPMYTALLFAEMGYFLYRAKFSLFFSDLKAILWNIYYLPETLYLKIHILRNSKKNNINTLFVQKSGKLMLFKNFSTSI